MNPFMTKMMASMGKMKEGMEKVNVEGRAGNAVHVKFRKRQDLSTEMYDITIAPEVIRDQPDRVAALVKEAVNDALAKEMKALQQSMPMEALQDLMKQQ